MARRAERGTSAQQYVALPRDPFDAEYVLLRALLALSRRVRARSFPRRSGRPWPSGPADECRRSPGRRRAGRRGCCRSARRARGTARRGRRTSSSTSRSRPGSSSGPAPGSGPSTTSASRSARARRSGWSASPAAARRRSAGWSCACSTRRAGTIRFDGDDITTLKGSALKPYRRRMQIIFQDPYASLDPRAPIGDSIGEGLRIHGLGSGRSGGPRSPG